MILKRLRLPIVTLLCVAFTVVGCGSDDEGTPPVTNTNATANQQPLGTSANDLLSDIEFRSLRLELAYADGFRPTQQTIDLIQSFLEERLNKPGGVAIVERIITPTETAPYDINEIVAIEDANRTVFNNGDEIGVWLFFSDGVSSGNSGNSFVLGTAYRNTSMVIYEKTFIDLANTSPTPINRTLLETSTLRHEFGHIFGLVNIGTPLTSEHEDQNNLRHCNVEGCLMFFQTVTSIFNTSDVATIPEFDPLCIADLQANGGL
jgi:predicted Zn-dependent protease